MSRIIGDRTKSALDEMEEVARERNRDVAEEDRLERIEEERERREGIIAKTEETIKVPSDDAKGLLEKINNIAKDTSIFYYDGEKGF